MLRLAEGIDNASPKEKMRAAFDMVDVDKSGYLDAKEVSEALKSFDSDLNEASPAAVLLEVLFWAMGICTVFRRCVTLEKSRHSRQHTAKRLRKTSKY